MILADVLIKNYEIRLFHLSIKANNLSENGIKFVILNHISTQDSTEKIVMEPAIIIPDVTPYR